MSGESCECVSIWLSSYNAESRLAFSPCAMSRQVEVWDLPEEEWPLIDLPSLKPEEASSTALLLSDTLPRATADPVVNQLGRSTGEEPTATEPQLPFASGSSLPEHRPTQVSNVIAASSSKRKPSKELKFDSNQPLKSRFGAVEVQCAPFALYDDFMIYDPS